MPLKLAAVLAAAVAVFCMQIDPSMGAIEAANPRVLCDKVASPLGSNSNPGTTTKPYATADKLASSLRAGQTGCLRGGFYPRDLKISKGGTAGAPIVLTSFPGERATVVGRIHVSETANNVVVQQLDLDGSNNSKLPSPTINGDNVAFRSNDVTNRNTSICFLVGSDRWGRAKGTVIENNRIHNCGQLPPTNHHHGIYVQASDGARIVKNWIYDNADRGIQLFPDAQGSYISGNVIDGNGQGIVFSGKSSNNVVEYNVITNPLVRHNLESYETTGTGNVARRNCLWSLRHWGNAGVQLGIEVSVVESIVVDPGFVNRPAKDFRLLPTSPCISFTPPAATRPAATKAQKRTRRVLRLRAAAPALEPGGRLTIRAAVLSDAALEGADAAELKILRHGVWRRVGAMKLRGAVLSKRVRLGKRVGRRSLPFGRQRVPRDLRTLQLRAYVRGVGHSNIVLVRVLK